MKLKKGDNVKVMVGKDKGKSGKIIQAFPNIRKVVVEGVNITTKHMRVRKEGEKGQKLQFAGPIAASNVMLICPKCAKPTRVGTKLMKGEGSDKKKARMCRKCKEVIE